MEQETCYPAVMVLNLNFPTTAKIGLKVQFLTLLGFLRKGKL